MYKMLTKAANLRGGAGRIFCLLLIAAVLIPAGVVTSPVSAQSPPGLPAMFYGTVTISGSSAAVGTVIQAQINSAVQGSFTVATAGSYGNMLVSNGNNGDTVQFYVNGVAAQTAVYHPGERNQIDLSTGGGGSAPSAPVLSLPASGATGASTTPTLQWVASSGAASYAVQVSTSSSFTTIAFSQSGITATSVAVSPALTAGTPYYWRANATNAYGTSSWASAWSFTTASVAPPAAPTLLSPSSGATGVSSSPMLQWNSSTGATSYTVQVSTSSAFSTTVFSLTGSATAATVTPALSNSIPYYWRANATGAGGTSSWSSTWSFTTAGSSPPAIPAFFKGVAYKNGAAVNAKQVCAIINSGSTCATSDTSGNYLVSVTGNTGDTVTFTVDGSAAAETATYSPGWMTNLNLHAGTGVLAVTTGSGTYVDSTSATLNGTLVSLSSLDTTATPSIDYGPTTAYEWGTWTMSSMAPGVFTTPAITGLTAGQVIHFKAKAVGDTTGATASGSDATYTHTIPGSLTVVTTSLTGGTVGTAYSSSPELRATGGTTQYTWSVASGSLPSWATLNTSTGVISGSTPTAGTSTFTVRVTDAASATATSGSLSIVISPATLSVVTTSLTGGTVGTAYSSSPELRATGGTTPYTWSIASGSLPSWATLNTSTGVISGSTPTAGTSTFTVRVTDAASATATSGSLSIVISGGGGSTEILGSTTGTPTINVMGNAIWLYRCQATGSNTITNINVKASWPGYVKVAIYADNGGDVGNLITANNTATAVTNTSSSPNVAKVNPVPITGTAITSPTYYWLAFVSDKGTIGGTKDSGVGRYQTISTTFADFTFPTSITGYVTTYNNRLLVAGAY